MKSAQIALARDERGAALVEFALIAPVFLLLVLGGLDLCHTMYVRSVLTGQLQKASRDFTLEDAASATRQAAITAAVEAAVQQTAPGALVTVTPTWYHNYSGVAKPEEFSDGNHDGVCNNKEAFVDTNRNGRWDSDSSGPGRGGAKDVVLLTATVAYDHLPLAAMFTGDSKVELVAKTLLRNQPNDQQAEAAAGVCS
ncbi:Flp pilus assembly pilin Flp [Novosphingobium chloroacetimidivorans]|uniref:Flp pilus assembly pilin Flp n=1 Tax=Novosphingobium chloroacetimidivorans TaxID=1428314 RepID=A0A7W7KEK4_9SPHN|nr:TadE/TadG family type IV pilus assembly protein [Novosphingobium chloroacetimidivorans]MBB4860986.1 Flp pilus assembly pilin Flp [Novosphingobium chloroacetimidivorans]